MAQQAETDRAHSHWLALSAMRRNAELAGDWRRATYLTQEMSQVRLKSGVKRNTGECRSCGAPIIWTITERGKRMPVDAEPRNTGFPAGDPPGNVRLRLDQSGTLESTVVGGGRLDVCHTYNDLYTSHFATCRGTHAKKWRKA